MASLAVREQAALVLRLPARERLELLLGAPRPMRLVRALPDAELYLTVREVGPADALPLLNLASSSQLQHLLDLEAWRKDRFDADRAGAWVAVFLEAGDATIRRFLRSADDDLLALLFQRWARVEPLSAEEQEESDPRGVGETAPGAERGPLGEEGGHRFDPTIARHRPAVSRIAQRFFRDQAQRYREVIWSAQHELPGELEERALHWRQSRLEEHGFPPWEEALATYAPPDGMRTHPQPPAPEDPDGLPAPLAPLRLPGLGERFSAALDGLPDAVRDRVLHEFASLANRLLVADGTDTGDPAAHRAALEKAAGYVAIALQGRGAADAQRMESILTELPLLELFREGHAAAAALQTRARALRRTGWAAGHARALDLLDSPLRERAAALLQPRPQYWEPGSESAPARLRPFRSMAEIDDTRLALEMAEIVGRAMRDGLGLDVERALRTASERGGSEAMRFSTFFLTALAWHAVRGELRADPLSAEVAADFLRRVASRRTAPPDAIPSAVDAFVARLAATLELDRRQALLLRAFGRACEPLLSTACGRLDPGVPVDPRSVSCLLLGP
jgi:hypothetical protein